MKYLSLLLCIISLNCFADVVTCKGVLDSNKDISVRFAGKIVSCDMRYCTLRPANNSILHLDKFNIDNTVILIKFPLATCTTVTVAK